VAHEALKGGQPVTALKRTVRATEGANGLQTVLYEQLVGNTRYFDAAGFPGRAVGVPAK
jgi:hypothetical protein